MKNKVWSVFGLLFMAVILLNGCEFNKIRTMKEYEIVKNWSFRQVGSDEWLPATVPGTVHTDLLDNGKIKEPFYRLNEHNLQWIDKEAWEYETAFSLGDDILQRERVEMHFSGLDTYAEVFLNDTLILKSDNMFQEYQIECKELLVAGNNKLTVKFESPIKRGIEKYDALGYKIPVSDNDLAEIGKVEGNKQVSIFTRKAGFHFGWDWGPRLVTSGIWRPVKIQAWDAIKINDLFVQQKSIGKVAQLTAHLEIEATSDLKDVTIEVLVGSKVVKTENINLVTGENTLQIPFEIEDPKRWWPNGMGEQKLYDIQLKVTDKSFTALKEERIGLREIKLVMEPDSMGTSFYFTVNGHPVFMKGANYIPQDVFQPRVDNERYKHILQSAKDANMNMLRVWGGGIYEEDVFYEMCDEMGLLVWQDFMFACAMFPGDDDFLASVKKEAIDNVKRLRNHPSIALWCGNNEILSAWENWGWKQQETKEQSKEVADVIWNAYDDIFHKVLAEVVEEYDVDRSYWPSSPGSEFGKKEAIDKGDMHYWGVWWGKEPFSNYETIMPRFMSEFGFQSFPELSTVEKYALPEDYDIYSEVMKSHQRSSIGNGTIKEYMLRHYNEPKDFESFLYVSHLLQAQGIGFGIEAHRRNRHRCMGTLYWQINDCWPVASWAGIDYYGKWKALHYEVKRKFEEYIISFKVENEVLKAFVVSDDLEDQPAVLKIELLDFDGNILNSMNKNIVITGNSSNVYTELTRSGLLGDNLDKNVVVKGTLIVDDKQIAQQLHYLKPYKEIEFPQPEISFIVNELDEQFELVLSCKKLAKGVFVSSNLNGNFSNNYFDLIPGDPERIYIDKEEMELNEFKNSLKIMSLVDSY